MLHDTEPTIQDVLVAMNKFSNQMENRFDNIEFDMATIKSTMVTKSYLDDKIADMKGDYTGLIRREDRKVNTIVSVLRRKSQLSNDDLNKINQVEVFAKRPTA